MLPLASVFFLSMLGRITVANLLPLSTFESVVGLLSAVNNILAR